MTITLLGLSCANQIPLTGGPRDENPPVLDTAISFKNEQLHFEKQNINLFFDEFITLKNPVKQVVVSPPLTYLPVTKGKGKKVSFEFNEKEELKEDVTYVINFGESIADYTEGNKLNNFTLVFSTGDYIDSLSIKGKVIESKSQKPVENYTVMLYESHYDSIVYKEKPFYFAKTDKTGIFQINNLRADTFKIFVLNDQNLNYLYDPDSEEIGFLDDLLIVSDTTSIDVTIGTFKERATPRFVGSEVNSKGYIELEFDETPPIERLSLIDSATMTYKFDKENDQKINLWYTDLNASKLSLAYRKDEETTDTITIRINLKGADDLDPLIRLSVDKPNGDIGQHPDLPIKVRSSYPIDSFDLGFILAVDTLSNDTLSISIEKDSSDISTLLIKNEWTEGSIISLTFLPGMITDLWGHSHDTISSTIKIAERAAFGSIALSTLSVPADTAYIIKVMKGDALIQQFSTELNTAILRIDKLVPGDYSLEIIEDLNKNGQWDPGVYLQRRPSERIFEKIPLEKLRENWILEYEVDISKIKSGKP